MLREELGFFLEGGPHSDLVDDVLLVSVFDSHKTKVEGNDLAKEFFPTVRALIHDIDLS